MFFCFFSVRSTQAFALYQFSADIVHLHYGSVISLSSWHCALSRVLDCAPMKNSKKKEQTVTIISSIPWLASPFSVCFIVPWTYWHAKCAVWKVYHFLPECQMAHHSRSWSEGPRPPGSLLAAHVGPQRPYRGARGPPEKCCCEAHLLRPSNTYITLTQPDAF